MLRFRFNIRFKMNQMTFMLLLILGVLFIAFVNNQMKQFGFKEAVKLSRLMISQNLATHAFINKEQKPTFFKLQSGGNLNEEAFIPELMSSTYIIRRINQNLMPLVSFDYYYKEVAINARSPENEAQGYEIEILKRLNNNEIDEFKEVMDFQGEKHLIFMLPGEYLEDLCLKCHGDPADAPQEMKDIYGEIRSFNRTTGQLASALSIRIPLSQAYAQANSVTLILALVYGLLLILTLIGNSLIFKRVVLNPLFELESRINHMLNKLPVKTNLHFEKEDEIQRVSKYFNLLQLKLEESDSKIKEHTKELEAKVKERTKELEELNIRLTEINQTDSFLGIMNRGTFEQKVVLEFNRAKRENKPVSVLVLDLDNFKKYNDIYGHQAGDTALKVVVKIIEKNIRDYDLFARYGGEEFVICMPSTGMQEVQIIARRIIDKIYGANMEHTGNPPYNMVTISIGIAVSGNIQEADYETMFKEADDNLYQAKRTKNSIFPH